MKEYAVIFERGEANWGVIVPDLPGCVSLGATLEEARRNVSDAIDLYIERLKERGDPIPEPTTQVGHVSVVA
jgi:predicted RNase H-like HicB family nuclease